MMKRVAVPPVHLDELEHETTSSGAVRTAIAEDPASGSRTFLLKWPGAHEQCPDDTELEWHSMHEEIILLGGGIQFGTWYELEAPGYINHPPWWVHPRQQRTDAGCEMLIRIDGPVDFGFMPIPDEWDGHEFFSHPPRDPGNRAVSGLPFDVLPWEPVLDPDGTESGLEAQTLYENTEDGWVTWLMRAPANWQSRAGYRELAGGGEILVLEGDFTPAGVGQKLEKRWFTANPTRFIAGGPEERSEAGCLAVRWTRRADLRLPHAPVPPPSPVRLR